MASIQFQQTVEHGILKLRLEVEHHTHSALEKSLIERTMQYIKDRTEGFDDYFPCRRKKNKCKLKHVKQWFNLFIEQHNGETLS